MRTHRCGTLRLRVLALASAAALGVAPPAFGKTIQASALAKQLALDQTITAPPGTIIHGPLKLQQIGVVRAAFECWRCTFDNDILARHVIFDREIDLGGVLIKGKLDLRGATFTKPVQLGDATRPATIAGTVYLTGATFGDLLDVGQAQFKRGVSLRFTRFRDNAFFSQADFERWADFTGAVFDGRARFDASEFQAAVAFDDALFRAGVSFAHAILLQRASLKSADFLGPTNFNGARFYGGADFGEARFRNGASFAGATVGGSRETALNLLLVVSQGGLDFERAELSHSVRADQIIASSLSFRDATFRDEMTLSIDDRTIGDLRLSLDQLGHLPEEQRRDTLKLIEDSAKSREEIRLANDAHYRLQKLDAEHYGFALRSADAVFYRGIAGYFVRPLRPLTVLVLLALAFAVGRRIRTAGLHIWGPVRAWNWLRELGREIFETLALALPRVGGGGPPDQEAGIGRRLEVVVYRVLFVCALIGFANSNPTLRQMLQALS